MEKLEQLRRNTEKAYQESLRAMFDLVDAITEERNYYRDLCKQSLSSVGENEIDNKASIYFNSQKGEDSYSMGLCNLNRKQMEEIRQKVIDWRED